MLDNVNQIYTSNNIYLNNKLLLLEQIKKDKKEVQKNLIKILGNVWISKYLYLSLGMLQKRKKE